jgi:enamine deaminase RidA (YjgF/YER057c/UK114 family)
MAGLVRFSNPAAMEKPPGYSQVVEITGPARIVYIAGQLGVDRDGRFVGLPDDFEAQCKQAFENLNAALASIGAGFADVVKITNFLVGMENMPTFRAIRDGYLNTAAPPASTTIGVPALARPGGLFEVEAIVALPAKARAKAKSRQTVRKSKAKTKKRKTRTAKRARR